MQCPRCEKRLQKVHTKQGVIVDHCEECKGIWLDEGEIFLFSKKPKWIKKALDEGLQSPHPSGRKCPFCHDHELTEGGFIQSDLLIDQCSRCNGLWFDDGELKKALILGKRKFRLDISNDKQGLFYADNQKQSYQRWQEHRSERENKRSALRAGLIPLPSLALRSTFSFVLLYGLLFFVLIIVSSFARWPLELPITIAVVIIILQYAIGPWILDLSLNWMYTINWVSVNRLPEHLQKFIQSTCSKKKMKLPRIGIIEDGTPNAFTYGHTPNNARVVITRGLLKYLDEDEVDAVVAHELGHAHHWDILVMTLASMVPILLYYVYRIFRSSSRGGSSKGKGAAVMLSILAYVVYIITEYIVLWLSRTREYWADRFAGEVTNNPNALSRALVKIAYGLVSPEEVKKKKGEEEKSANLDAINTLSIFDVNSAKTLALNAYSKGNVKKTNYVSADKERIVSAMQWDLWNPWAAYYEIHSTHPLPAKRMEALADQAAVMNQDPIVTFNRQKPESYWDEFFVDLFMMYLPIIPFIAIMIAFSKLKSPSERTTWRIIAYGLAALGACYLLKVLYRYRGKIFPHMKISSLLGKVKVSDVRSVPVTLKGKVVGRGVPGYMFSEDMVMEDETGIIFLDYQQPLGIFELIFALMRTERYTGREITVEGWYRRSPVPYIEIKRMWVGSNTHTCYVYHMKLIVSLLLFAASIFCFLLSTGKI